MGSKAWLGHVAVLVVEFRTILTVAPAFTVPIAPVHPVKVVEVFPVYFTGPRPPTCKVLPVAGNPLVEATVIVPGSVTVMLNVVVASVSKSLLPRPG